MFETITIFSSDLAQSDDFYRNTLRLTEVFADDACVMFDFSRTTINVLKITEAAELVDPRTPKTSTHNPTSVFTIIVESCDQTVASIRENGSEPISGPIDRPWGRRTAMFADPDGYLWEFAEVLEAAD